MIKKISVTNFKSHDDTKIEMGRITALVGPNGSGKTAILQAIYYLTLLTEQSIEQVFRGNRSFHHLVRHNCLNLQIFVSGENFFEWSLLLKTSLSPKSDGHYFPSEWHSILDWQCNGLSGSDKLERDYSLRNTSAPSYLPPLLGMAAYFKPAFANLAAPSVPTEITPQVALDGSGLASVVANLMTYHKERFQSVQAALQEIVPTVQEIRVRRAKVEIRERKALSINNQPVPYDEQHEAIGDELVFDTTSAKEVAAHAMSEGTLLVLGILTLIHGPNSPSLILLDDIEQGLHPLAQRRLMTTLKAFTETYDKQILLTSHSPYIVDELEAKDVWVMAADKEGISRCKRLSDHPDAKRALEVLTTGEFLGAEGEEWVLDPPAVKELAHA